MIISFQYHRFLHLLCHFHEKLEEAFFLAGSGLYDTRVGFEENSNIELGTGLFLSLAPNNGGEFQLSFSHCA